MSLKFLIKPNRLFVLSVLLLAIIFVLELMMPFHALAAVGYVIVMFCVLQFPQQSKYATVLGAVTTVLIVLEYLLAPKNFKDENSMLLNRSLSVLMVWLAVYFNVRHKKHMDSEVRSREQLSAIFNNAAEGMLITDQWGKVILVNDFAAHQFGYEKGELIGKPIECLLPERFGVAHEKYRKDFMDQPQSRHMAKGRELLARRKDGTEFPVEVSLSYFKNERGVFAIAFITDLTERKQAQENLNREQKLAQTYFELAPVLFLITSTSGHIMAVNEYVSHRLGYAKSDMVGKHITYFLDDDVREKVWRHFGKIAEGRVEELHHESQVKNSCGETVIVSWKNVTIKDESGKVLVVLSVGIDITEKKRQERLALEHHEAILHMNDELEEKIRKRTMELAEAVYQLEQVNHELEKNQQLFKAVAQHFPDGVIGVLNKEMRYVFADGQELHHMGLGDHIQGERVFDNLHPALSDQAEEKLKEVFSGTNVTYDVELGEDTYTINAVPLPTEEDKINEILVVIKNITERKQVEKDLMKSVEKEKELNSMKSKFVTLASHEFRTPLSTILSSAYLLEKYSGLELEVRKSDLVGKIKRSVNNLTALLNDFMLLGKLEEGKVKIEYTEINIHGFLKELIPEMELIRKGNQIIRCEYIGPETSFSLDKSLLRSILLNLLGNAIKYSSADAQIKLVTTVTDKDITINVIDNGIGIPEQEQRHIFERFYRASNATNIEGTGLGLNIIRNYVKLLNGKIEFKSKLNEGTTFTVTLPTDQQPNEHQSN